METDADGVGALVVVACLETDGDGVGVLTCSASVDAEGDGVGVDECVAGLCVDVGDDVFVEFGEGDGAVEDVGGLNGVEGDLGVGDGEVGDFIGADGAGGNFEEDTVEGAGDGGATGVDRHPEEGDVAEFEDLVVGRALTDVGEGEGDTVVGGGEGDGGHIESDGGGGGIGTRELDDVVDAAECGTVGGKVERGGAEGVAGRTVESVVVGIEFVDDAIDLRWDWDSLLT